MNILTKLPDAKSAKSKVKAKLPKEISSAFYSIVPQKERIAFEKVMDYGKKLNEENRKLQNESHKISNELNDLYRTFSTNLKNARFDFNFEKSILTITFDENIKGKISSKLENLVNEYKVLVNKNKPTSDDRKKSQNLYSEINLAIRRELSDSGVTEPRYLTWTVECVYEYERIQKKEVNLSKNKTYLALRKRKVENETNQNKNDALREEFQKQMCTTECIAGSRMSPFMMMHPAMIFGGFR